MPTYEKLGPIDIGSLPSQPEWAQKHILPVPNVAYPVTAAPWGQTTGVPFAPPMSFEEIPQSTTLEPGVTYRATARINRSWASHYSTLIHAGVRTYDLLNERISITAVNFNLHSEITNPKFFDVIVSFQVLPKPEVLEAGMSGAQIGMLLAGALFAIVLISATMIKFERAVNTVTNTVFSPGTIILAVVALFLILKFGKGN